MYILDVITLYLGDLRMGISSDEMSTLSTEAGYCSLNKLGRPNEDRYRLLGGGFIVPDNRQTAFYNTQRGEIYAVMDGVGGASHGMAAAQYIADQLPMFFTQTLNSPLTIDILNGVIKPEGNPEIIKNSLYALSKTSEFFGEKLYPVKIDFNAVTNAVTQERRNAITPFITR